MCTAYVPLCAFVLSSVTVALGVGFGIVHLCVSMCPLSKSSHSSLPRVTHGAPLPPAPAALPPVPVLPPFAPATPPAPPPAAPDVLAPAPPVVWPVPPLPPSPPL